MPAPGLSPGMVLLLLAVCSAGPAFAGAAPQTGPAFSSPEQTRTARALLLFRQIPHHPDPAAGPEPSPAQRWQRMRAEFPRECDWLLQDGGPDLPARFFAATAPGELERPLIARVLNELNPPASGTEAASAAPLQARFQALCAAPPISTAEDWLVLYLDAAEARRQQRLRPAADVLARGVVFTKRATPRPSFFAYTEGQSDAQAERHFLPGSELCLLEVKGGQSRVRSLLRDPTGVIRDPAVSWDARHVVFAWKKSLNEDDYHLYELDLASGRVRQITSGLGFADYEPAFLPDGSLIFSSTRCVQTVDCWWTEASNLYTCGRDGRFLRRLTFDQVHSIGPQVLDDGRVIYTRWDYNDRGQVFPQALFQMNADGTGQTEFYGNNSWFPTTIAHARGIPGTGKVLAVFCGHHTSQAGKLGILDPSRGRQENWGAQLVAPLRPTPPERIDAYGQAGELFQYPFPLNERAFLVAYAAEGWASSQRGKGDAPFGIYWMDVEGRREWLASDARLPCQQPVPLIPRTPPRVTPSRVDYRQQEGFYYVQDIYSGPGLAGVLRGQIKTLRVVALDFRAAGVGKNFSRGPAGGALASTPVSIGNGSWDVKVVLGEATVHEDGSAFFAVPARTPVYFQALDEKGRAVQTMRSWSTLQPGEVFSCTGCHEHKNTAPLANHYPAQAPSASLALRAGPESLQPASAPPPRGFSFPRDIQPILDRHCIRCHDQRTASLFSPPSQAEATSPAAAAPPGHAFSLLGATTEDGEAKRHWSDAYLALVGAHRIDWQKQALFGENQGRLVNWAGAQSVPEPLPARFAGSIRSGLPELLEKGHYDVRLSRQEMARICCWIDLMVPYCGDYTEAAAWTEAETQKYQRYLDKRRLMEAQERANIAAYLANSPG